MTERVDSELALLRTRVPDLEFLESGLWVRVPKYVVPGEHWIETEVALAFCIPPNLPGQDPYGFWIANGLTPRTPGSAITNYTFPTRTGFPGRWGQFSWAPADWHPGPTAESGDNMVSWLGTFASRLREGP